VKEKERSFCFSFGGKRRGRVERRGKIGKKKTKVKEKEKKV
jgi:hypothetical protein